MSEKSTGSASLPRLLQTSTSLFLLKPSEDIIIYPLLIDWQKQALEAVLLGSFVMANVLRLVASNIVLGGIRGRGNPVGVLHDVQSAKTLGKVGHLRCPLVVGLILSASSIFDETLSQLESLIAVPSFARIILTIPLCLWGIQPEHDGAGGLIEGYRGRGWGVAGGGDGGV